MGYGGKVYDHHILTVITNHHKYTYPVVILDLLPYIFCEHFLILARLTSYISPAMRIMFYNTAIYPELIS